MVEDMGCNMKIAYAQINNMEDMIGEQNNMLKMVVDNMTLTTRQQSLKELKQKMFYKRTQRMREKI